MMDVKVMKMIDRRVGVPACALHTIYQGLRSLLVRPVTADAIHRVLFIVSPKWAAW